MEFFGFLGFLLFWSGVSALLTYYARLLFFEKKDAYPRHELTEPIPETLRIFFEVFSGAGKLTTNILAFVLGAFFAFLWAHWGGMIGSPSYTASFGNYFFHSPILFYLLYLAFPYLKEGFASPRTEPLWESEAPLLSGVVLGLLAQSWNAWAFHGEFSFLFLLLGSGLSFYPLVFLWNEKTFLGRRLQKPENWRKDTFDEF